MRSILPCGLYHTLRYAELYRALRYAELYHTFRYAELIQTARLRGPDGAVLLSVVLQRASFAS